MSKKLPVTRFSGVKAKAETAERSWHNGADVEIHLYARSLQSAAKTLVTHLERKNNPLTNWDTHPVVLLYRQSLELHLKFLVGEGSKFLKSRTDPISLYRTRSLRWLVQIVCQIIRTVGWEKEFTCEGVVSLSDFSGLVNEVESLDSITQAIQPSRFDRQAFEVVAFAKRIDAVLDLLHVTADALAATWDRLSHQSASEEAFRAVDDIDWTIQ
jgi:hypothetical protein